MEDDRIIDLFYARSEQAIVELSKKYGAVCGRVARNILGNSLDAEECVNDAYLGVWNTVPPKRPAPLSSYLCRIVRNLSVTRYHSNTAAKRNSFYDVALDELEECLASSMEYCEGEPHYGDAEGTCSFTVNVSKGGIVQEPDRSISLRLEQGVWKVVNEGY